MMTGPRSMSMVQVCEAHLRMDSGTGRLSRESRGWVEGMARTRSILCKMRPEDLICEGCPEGQGGPQHLVPCSAKCPVHTETFTRDGAAPRVSLEEGSPPPSPDTPGPSLPLGGHEGRSVRRVLSSAHLRFPAGGMLEGLDDKAWSLVKKGCAHVRTQRCMCVSACLCVHTFCKWVHVFTNVSVRACLCAHLCARVCMHVRQMRSATPEAEGWGAHGLAGLRWGGRGAGATAVSERTRVGESCVGQRQQEPARQDRVRKLLALASQPGPWCCAHTRTAGCPRARSTRWRAEAVLAPGGQAGRRRSRGGGAPAPGWEEVGGRPAETLLWTSAPEVPF